MLYEIKNRWTGAVLFSLECGSLKICIEAAVQARANLADAYLARANLAGANLARAYLASADLAGAYLAGAYLARAYLADAYLARANLAGADLAGAYLVDGGQDARGFRFWAWHKDGVITYRAGCHAWTDISEALAYYSETYKSTGDRDECAARLLLMQSIAEKRWPSDVKQEAAA